MSITSRGFDWMLITTRGDVDYIFEVSVWRWMQVRVPITM